MPIIIDKKASFIPGVETVIESHSESGSWVVIFEDNEETGYFYCCNISNGKTKILDAVQIYSVNNIADKNLESECKIGWSPDGNSALLMINDFIHAIVDFGSKRTCCRTGFPPSKKEWSSEGHQWDETMLSAFKV